MAPSTDHSPRRDSSYGRRRDGSSTALPSSTVFLNVYDIVPYNDVLVPWGLGVHHTGIEVHGMEIAFGRCQRGSGVFECHPKRCPGHKFREQLVLGTTPYSQGDVEQWLLYLMHAHEDHQEATSSHDAQTPMLREAATVNGRDNDDDDEGGDENDGRFSPVEKTTSSSQQPRYEATPTPTPRVVPHLSYSESEDISPEDARYWLGQRYHLLRNNCNHFSAYVASKLLPALPSPPFGQDASSGAGGVELALDHTKATRWLRGVPSDVGRYEAGHMELVTCRLNPTGGAPSLVPSTTETANNVLPVSNQVLLDALVPTWVNRLSVLGCSLLPASWVDQLETLDRQAQNV
ncbi:Hypothetical protein, putative [Bodo saltans]|uniref:PPPDE domain-containing protein n=1 Tax=Bodo saltans TaxID=75058 RepID=A0A0S4J9K6_BODSA|nr:Hypothetical protein, putative [Bodo saltans]|eukprot:CUG88190.1 Hypothetical protein, putative [Bodo saltans]